jgi:cell volume regulation protein A
MRAQRLIFTAGPWNSDWGEQDEPRQVSGIQVARELLRREGGGETLVLLADGRFALTGATYAAGTARALMRHARRRSRCLPDGDRAWLLSVIEELNRRARSRLRPARGRSHHPSSMPY